MLLLDSCAHSKLPISLVLIFLHTIWICPQYGSTILSYGHHFQTRLEFEKECIISQPIRRCYSFSFMVLDGLGRSDLLSIPFKH